MRIRNVFSILCCIFSLSACLENSSLDISSGSDFTRQGISVKGEDVYKGGISKITISLNYVTPRDVKARVRTESGSAVSGTDFAAVDKDITIKAGSASVDIPVVTFARRSFNTSLYFKVTLSEVDGADVVNDSALISVTEPLLTNSLKGAVLLAGSQNSFCAKLNDSRVYCWGDNRNGQVTGDAVASNLTFGLTMPSQLDSDPIKLSSNGGSFCALYADGRVKCWGMDLVNQIAPVPLTALSVTSLAVSSLLSTSQSAKDVSVSGGHTCVILSTNAVWCVGWNANGQLGRGTTTNATSLAVVTGLSSTAVSVAASDNSTCALLQSGAVYCWGANDKGQLATGNTTQSTTAVASLLTSGVTSLTAGVDHFCALKTGGVVSCWGYNGYGQLGSSFGTNKSSPVDVILPYPAMQVSASGNHTCALLTNGQLYCWGSNVTGELGDGTLVSRDLPLLVPNVGGPVKLVASSSYSTCAILEENSEVVCWGSNYRGQTSGTPPNMDHATDIVELAGVKLKDLSMASVMDPTFAPQSGCAVLDTGELKCFGTNNNLQMGRGAPVTNPAVSWPLDYVTGMSTAGSVKSIAMSAFGACALLGDTSMKCWGYKTMVGINSASDVYPPQSPTGITTGVAQVSIGGDTQPCALLDNGKVYCWIGNTYGGAGSCTVQNTPNMIPSITTGVHISTGQNAACAVLSDGSVKCWGNNTSGLLGNAKLDSACNSTPSLALVPEPASKVAVGYMHACALSKTGLVYCWGDNLFGQTGQATTGKKTTPALVQNLRDVVDVVAGTYHTCAATKSGAVYCWGADFNNELGINRAHSNTIYQPTLVKGLSIGVKSLHVGNANTCALTDEGYGKCWGPTFLGDRERISLVFFPRKVNDGRVKP